MSTIDKYILLLTQFVNSEIAASEFDTLYLEQFKKETETFPEEIYDILNNLFSDVDAYCEDPDLRDDEDLDEDELLISAKKALEELA